MTGQFGNDAQERGRIAALEEQLAEMQAQRDVLVGLLYAVRQRASNDDDGSLCMVGDLDLFQAIHDTLATLPTTAARYRAVVEAAVAMRKASLAARKAGIEENANRIELRVAFLGAQEVFDAAVAALGGEEG